PRRFTIEQPAQEHGDGLFHPLAGPKDCCAARRAEGLHWLERLPERVNELAQAWSLTVHPAFDVEGFISWTAPAQLPDGSDVVLKVGLPHPETRHQADALRVYDGNGAVRLLRVSGDGFALPLERCLPRTDLSSLP